MRLALLSGANPRVANDGAKVRLGRGSWKLEFSGLNNSRFMLVLQSKPFANPAEDQVVPLPVQNGQIFNLEIEACAQLIWEHRGTEAHITAIAEKQ